MRKEAMYQEYPLEYVGKGVICQEIVVITENPDGASMAFYCVNRDANRKIIGRGSKPIKHTDTFERCISMCKSAGLELVEEVERMENFYGEYAIFYELANGKVVYLYDDESNYYFISRTFDNVEKATEVASRQGFRF